MTIKIKSEAYKRAQQKYSKNNNATLPILKSDMIRHKMLALHYKLNNRDMHRKMLNMYEIIASKEGADWKTLKEIVENKIKENK